MKKIRLNVADLGATEILSREQLKSVFGGSGGSSSDSGSGSGSITGCRTQCPNGNTIGKEECVSSNGVKGDCFISTGVSVRCVSNYGARYTLWDASC